MILNRCPVVASAIFFAYIIPSVHYVRRVSSYYDDGGDNSGAGSSRQLYSCQVREEKTEKNGTIFNYMNNQPEDQIQNATEKFD